ncbi:Exodeoxyribonuclease III Xth [Elusimicrobium minutum Pei191]|uniref:Exodeoxyribonuclease III Xth n=1 Tax=Elusimicrobium minutum (strain Pei191) TaxID=445932 RepID=B2KE51_ELUMP|nr:exodeoxyribonuclease III [Elusimicrobium minutum]ACC98797.1 Exodeoxyribonuclease III Xth [Elusimicrobium minutum Pei191]
MTKRFISWNVNGLRAVAKKGFMEWFTKESPDILALQETKASPEQLEGGLKNPIGYHSYFSTAERKGYSGVAVYSKEEPLSVSESIGNSTMDGEGRTLVLEFKNFYFINIYFPNGGQGEHRIEYKLRFYNEFLKLTQKLMKQKTVIVCGDVNTAHKETDLARPKENEGNTGFLPKERAWLDKFFENGLTDTFRLFTKDGGHYTWWDYKTKARERNVGWRIDYFMIDTLSKNKVKNSYMLPEVQGSDHCPIALEINL